jgi:hypothetical protein
VNDAIGAAAAEDLLDITGQVSPVLVVGPYEIGQLSAWYDGQWYYFADSEVARIAAHLTGSDDLSGREVTIERDVAVGWIDHRRHIGGGPDRRTALHVRHIDGVDHYRFDGEWLFHPSDAVPRAC